MESTKRPLPGGNESSSGNPANIQLENVRLLWLEGPPRESIENPVPLSTSSCPLANSTRFLLLEDTDTGDILLPLIYLRSILEANYSRKLAALKYREVQVRAGTSMLPTRPVAPSPRRPSSLTTRPIAPPPIACGYHRSRLGTSSGTNRACCIGTGRSSAPQ